MSEASPKSRRGLILAGGGAKGAYAFGCLKAFRDANVGFDVVAGTSVGALNAALWATCALDEGEKIWNELSFSTVYPPVFPGASSLPRWLARLVAVIYVCLRLFWETLWRRPNPLEKCFRNVWAAVGVVPVAAGAWLVCDNENYAPWKVMCVVTVAAAMFFVLFRGALRSGLEWQATSFAGYALAMVAFFFIVLESVLRVDTRPPRLVAALAMIVPPLLVALVVGVGFFVARRRWFSPSESLLSSLPLQETLTRVFSRNLFRVPTFVTFAYESSVFDPDDPHWFPEEPFDIHSPPVSERTWLPNRRQVWTPHYVEIHDRPPEHASRLCAASAALPFGIVPPITIGGRRAVDGGVVDNVPFSILVGRVDEIYIVVLDSFGSEAEALKAIPFTRDRWAELHRLQRLERFELPAPIRSRHLPRAPPEKQLPLLEPPSWPAAKVFFPAASLGGFLNGTLRFEAGYARGLIARGYKETMVRLIGDASVKR